MGESLAIGYVHPGHVDAHFMQSVVNVIVDDAQRKEHRIVQGGSYIAVGSGPRIAEARNTVVESFLNQCAAEWLLMLDTDMVFPITAIDKLFERADPETAPIIGGLCFGGGRSGIMFPTMYRLVKAEANQSPVQIIEEYPEDALCEVDATGAAFLLMHRDALRKMGEIYSESPYPWFLEGSVYKNTKFGEDWAFCMRAKEAGYKIHVHTGAKIGHVKPQVLDEDSWLAFKEKKAVVGEAGVAQAFKEKIMGGAEKPTNVPTYVVIPQKGKVDMTRRLCHQLHTQGGVKRIYIMDNGSNQTDLAATYKFAQEYGAAVIESEGKTIHQMWNEGVNRIQSREGTANIAILNNDLRIGPHFLLRLSTALRADNDLTAVCPNYDNRKGSGIKYVIGTKGMGGMSGFAFMFKGERFANKKPFDESFKWWYGDDDFALCIMDSGEKVGFVYGVTVEHIDGGSQTAKDHPFDEIIRQDREHFCEKHHFVENEDGNLVRQLQEVS